MRLLLLLSLLLLADESVEKLREALSADSAAARREAAAALGALGEKGAEARRDLVDRLGDANAAVRTEAARALVRIGCDKEAALLLVKRLSTIDPELGPLVAEAIATAGAGVVEALAESPHRFANLALGYMGREGVRGLPALLDRAEQEFAAEAIRRLAPWGAPVVPELLDRLRFGEEAMRLRAASALGLVGPAAREAIAHLREAQAEGSPAVREAAAKALAAVDLPEPRPEHPLLRKPDECREKAPERFFVLFETTRGEIEIEVIRAWAPHGADRFWNLVRVGYFREARFFRVLEGFIAQFGIHADSRVSGLWRGKDLADDPVREKNVRGTLAYAMAGPETRGTQLFFNLKDNATLDEQSFVPIGRVRKGMEVVDAIYAGYGEEPDPQSIEYSGNAHLERHFPRLDSIRDARILDE